ncbi:ABC transporter substrate-binding protein [Microlunatus flavus]|uniref:Multiple sugar transport system substrate-binding protein n=1 Tax=Microlunatus flavus TaxID=1036181 RepID=A0A1H9EVH2_9ACTN|nr:sugar ABC transporter substrate-binding protein [Microlunatus flavus]SEQ28998.1 multiple sugar transport system substrate-binding protein [Microlunatus flavus]
MTTNKITTMLTRRRTTRWAAVAALAALAPLSLAACGGGGSAGSSGGDAGATVSSLKVLDYYTDEPGKTQIGDMLNACGTSIGVGSIEREAVPGPTLIQKVLQQASSKSLPDVLMLDNPDIQQIADTGALAPLGDFGLTADGYAPGPVAAATADGKLYGLQPGANTIAIFYRKDVLEKAGVKPPTTWDELRTAAKKLTVGKQYGFAFNATADYEGAWQFLPPMWTNGGDETDLKSPQVAQALQLWKDLVDDGSASKSVVNWKQSDVNDQFIAGKAAMMLNGPWQEPALDKAKVDYGVVPFPVNTAGQTSVAPLGGEAWTVPMTGDKARMAKAAELVKCMNSDDNQMLRAKQGGLVPTKLALASQFKSEVPAMAGFTDAVGQARARTGKLGAKWPDTAKTIYTGVQLVLTGQAAPADAMAKAGA